MPSRAVISAVFLAVALALLATAAYRGRSLRSTPRPPDVIALVLLLSFLAISFAVQAPAAREILNLLRVNLGQLLGNGFTLLGATAATAMVLFILYEPADALRRLRRRGALLTVTLVTMTALFWTNPAEPEEFTDPAAPAGIIAYYFLYLIYLAIALVDLTLLIRRRASGEADRWVRSGMQLVSVACAVALLYTVGRMFNLTVDHSGVEVVSGDDLAYGLLEFIVAAVLPAVAVMMAIAGFTFRQWAPTVLAPIIALKRMRRHRAAYARLEPLWTEVHQVLPRISLPDRDSRRTRPSLQLYGRVIEICDAEMLASPFVPSGQHGSALAEAHARGLEGEDALAVADAVVLMAGLHALRGHTAPELQEAQDSRELRMEIEGLDLDREAARLERVAEAYRHSPLVTELAAAADSGR